jgi:hypothetical protein
MWYERRVSSEAPIVKLLFEPRAFFVRHASYFPPAWIVIFAIFFGVDRKLSQAFKRAIPLDDTTFLGAVTANIVVGAIMGVSMIWIASWVFGWLVNQFGGSASSETMRKVLGWSALPKIPMVFGFLILLAVQGERFFTQDRMTQLKASPVLIGGFMLTEFALSIWSIVIGVVGISEMGKLSVFKSIGVLLVGGVFLFIALAASALLLVAFR